MPKVDPLRSLANERNAAERIRLERLQRGWSYPGLAKRLSDAGASLHPTAIYKIERGDPPRRITVDELVAFGRVFRIDVSDMLMPMGQVLDKHALKIVRKIDADLDALARTVGSLVDSTVDLVKLEGSSESTDQDVLRRANTLMPSLTITYPMGDEDDPATPDPIHDAWGRLADGVLTYARWHVANEGT